MDFAKLIRVQEAIKFQLKFWFHPWDLQPLTDLKGQDLPRPKRLEIVVR